MYRINHYPVVMPVCFLDIYPLDSDLSGRTNYISGLVLEGMILMSLVLTLGWSLKIRTQSATERFHYQPLHRAMIKGYPSVKEFGLQVLVLRIV